MSQCPFRAGKSEGGSPLTIGSTPAWDFSVTMKYSVILFNHNIECANADKRENVNFSVP